jgi:hypothetical protein
MLFMMATDMLPWTLATPTDLNFLYLTACGFSHIDELDHDKRRVWNAVPVFISLINII